MPEVLTRGDLNKAWVSVHHVSSSLFVTNVLHKGNQVWGSQFLSLFYRKSKTPLKSTTYSEATRKVSLVLRNGRRGAGTVGSRGDWVAMGRWTVSRCPVCEGRAPGRGWGQLSVPGTTQASAWSFRGWWPLRYLVTAAEGAIAPRVGLAPAGQGQGPTVGGGGRSQQQAWGRPGPSPRAAQPRGHLGKAHTEPMTVPTPGSPLTR